MKSLIKINIPFYRIFLLVLTGIFNYSLSIAHFTLINKSDSLLSTACQTKIDSIAQYGLYKKAYPGCQVIILVKGKIAYQKSYGYHTYDNIVKVKDTDLYDLASITKVAATTLCLMKLVDEGKLNPDDKLSKYLPYLLKTNKGNLIIRDILTHQAGLQAWFPYYKSTLISGNKLNALIYSKVKTHDFSIPVAKDLYIKNIYRDSIFKQIINSPLGNSKYLYSDLGFYLLADLIKRTTGKEINEYVYDKFYKPMELLRMTYLPLNKFSLSEIIPTEYDTIFRKQLIHGYVHDPGAAMLGGISGHAGLFSDAKDLAFLFQMLIQNGKYNGKTYVKASTIKEFTKCQFPLKGNRRGLGFDKPPLNKDINGPCCQSASKNSFGHSGFTGTYVWADPDYNLVYVFLSNRINPDVNNHKITEMNIRTNIQQIIYDCLQAR